MTYNNEQLNRAIATEIMNIPIRKLTEENSSFGVLKSTSPEYQAVIEKAISSGPLALHLTGCHKGLDYEATLDGWDIMYHLPYSEAYRASEVYILDGEVADWGPTGKELEIFPAAFPDYANSLETAMTAWTKIKSEKPDLQLVLVDQNPNYAAAIGDESINQQLSQGVSTEVAVALCLALLEYARLPKKEVQPVSTT